MRHRLLVVLLLALGAVVSACAPPSQPGAPASDGAPASVPDGYLDY